MTNEEGLPKLYFGNNFFREIKFVIRKILKINLDKNIHFSTVKNRDFIFIYVSDVYTMRRIVCAAGGMALLFVCKNIKVTDPYSIILCN